MLRNGTNGTSRNQTERDKMDTIEQKVDWTKIDTHIKFEGKEITLPGDPSQMDYDDAINTIARIRDQENQQFDVNELVEGAPWDTLVAVYRAMQEIYGVVLAQNQKTWFGEIKPEYVTIVTGPNPEHRIQVPSGQMSLPGVEAPIHIVMRPQGTFVIGTVRRRDRARLVEIANRARAIIREQSVYKSKAIRLNVDDDGNLDLNQQPEFLDLATVKEDDVIHTQETEGLIRTNIFAPLKYTAAARANRIPLKRGILLEGKYGCGKSLTARVTAKIAIDNGWTFIMLNRAEGLKAAIEFARQYQPCVIFAEDIDRAADRTEDGVNDLVNLLDGMISKTMEMMVVLTTNFIEKIDQALLRPGRFDAVIPIDAPDAITAQRIIRAYAAGLLSADANLAQVGEVTKGMIPASIREVVERAKLSMLIESRNEITPEDLRISAIGMQRHMDLLAPKSAGQSHAEKFAEAFVGLIGNAVIKVGDDMATEDDVTHARDRIIQIVARAHAEVTRTREYAAAGATGAHKVFEQGKKTHLMLESVDKKLA